MEIAKLLKTVDVSVSEAEVFSALIAFDSGATVVQLARVLNVARPTVYDRLEQLIAKHLVKKGREESGSVYYPERTEEILHLYEEKKKAIERDKKLLGETLHKTMQVSSYSPRFTVLRGDTAADQLFRDVLRSREKSVCFFWPAKEMLHTVPDDVFQFWYRERIDRGIFLKILWPKKQYVPIEKTSILGSVDTKKALREIRILPDALDTTMAHCIYGNKVGFLSSTREYYGFIIDSKELSENLRGQFEYLWKQSRKYKET